MIGVGRKRGKKIGTETQVRIDSEIARKLKIVAAIRNEKITDILNRITNGPVDRMYRDSVEGLGDKPK